MEYIYQVIWSIPLRLCWAIYTSLVQQCRPHWDLIWLWFSIAGVTFNWFYGILKFLILERYIFIKIFQQSENLYSKLDPSKSELLKLSDCSMVLEEQPEKIIKAVKLFLQGLGFHFNHALISTKRFSKASTKYLYSS